MSKTAVPSAPMGKIGANASEKARPKIGSPLDAAFLARIYRSMLWFGLVITILAAFGTKSAAIASSVVAGLFLAAALLRVQEIGVRALMRPAEQIGGFDARLLMVLLLPLKFVVIVAALVTLNYFKLIVPGALALGFFAGQLVIVAKVAGWMMVRAAQK